MNRAAAPPEWDMILTASMKNNAPEIRRLIEKKGVSPSHSNAVSQSALHIASLWGNVEAVEALLDHKASVNAQNTITGATPLHCTVQSAKGPFERRVACIEKLIAHGADVSMADFFGKTAAEYCKDNPALAQKLQPQSPPLFQAIGNGNVDEVQQMLLVDNGNNKNNSPSKDLFLGQTPFLFTLDLLLAEEDNGGAESQQQQMKQKWVEILKALLEAGADVNDAFTGNNSSPVQALEGPVSPPLHRVCSALQIAYKNKDTASIPLLEETCKLFLQHQAQVTPELEQLLHTACRKNESDLVKLLINVVGIDPNVQGRQGMTALQFAARAGKLDMVQYLLTQPNINTDIKDDRGQTALDAARVNSKQDVVALLENFTAHQDQQERQSPK